MKQQLQKIYHKERRFSCYAIYYEDQNKVALKVKLKVPIDKGFTVNFIPLRLLKCKNATIARNAIIKNVKFSYCAI